MAKHDHKFKKQHPRAAHTAHFTESDLGSLSRQLSRTIDWALDMAEIRSSDCDEELDTIRRVRSFVQDWPVTDLLTNIADPFAALEIEFGIDNIALLDGLSAVLEDPSRLFTLLTCVHCPGATRDGESRTHTRRFPGRRNASAAFSQLAA